MIKQRDEYGLTWRDEEEIPDENRGIRLKYTAPSKEADKENVIVEHIRPNDGDTPYLKRLSAIKKKGGSNFWWCYLDEDF